MEVRAAAEKENTVVQIKYDSGVVVGAILAVVNTEITVEMLWVSSSAGVN